MLQAYGIKGLVMMTGVHSSGIANDRNGAYLCVLEKDVERAKELLKSGAE